MLIVKNSSVYEWCLCHWRISPLTVSRKHVDTNKPTTHFIPIVQYHYFDSWYICLLRLQSCYLVRRKHSKSPSNAIYALKCHFLTMNFHSDITRKPVERMWHGPYDPHPLVSPNSSVSKCIGHDRNPVGVNCDRTGCLMKQASANQTTALADCLNWRRFNTPHLFLFFVGGVECVVM